MFVWVPARPSCSETALTGLVLILLLPLAIVTAFFAIQLFIGLPGGRVRQSVSPDRFSAVIVVPAHDEAAIIEAPLTELRRAAGAIPILVVADNCTDATARLARAAGAEVIERTDPAHRGKGYALAHAARHLQPAAPQVVVVIDADCSIDGASLNALVDCAGVIGRPAQAVNLLRPDRSAPPMVQLSTFGFMLKNLVRQRGLQRMAGQVHLTGTGMALPFALFTPERLATANIVEDLALGLELAEQGYPTTLVSTATVWSGGASAEGTLAQRRRWEGGFLQTSLRRGPRMLARGLRRANPKAILAALDMLVPPLALLALLNALLLVIGSLLTWVSGAAWWPIGAQLLIIAAAAVAVLAVWWRHGREFISFGVLARLPVYVLWKLPLYLRLGRSGAPRDWLRTGR
jgi:cellulose synthase/poly-beta-1,6-N-acetylglucosamine synthase-like glycosyltransferase